MNAKRSRPTAKQAAEGSDDCQEFGLRRLRVQKTKEQSSPRAQLHLHELPFCSELLKREAHFFDPYYYATFDDPIQCSRVTMALIQTTLIWVVYAVVLALLFAVASIFIYLYQAAREKSYIVTAVCIFTLTSLLATVLLLPVDIALVSSTTSSKLGRRKDWATQDRVDNILLTLKIVYYTLFSLDAILCLLVVPFTYFWYEEYDEAAAEEGNQTVTERLWGAFKYTIAFVFLVVIIFLVGFFVPVAKDRQDAHYDYGYFKNLLRESRESTTRI